MFDFFVNHGFIVELFLATALYVISLKRRNFFVVRVIVFTALMFGISIIWDKLFASTPINITFKYICLFFVATACIFACFKEKFWVALFCEIGAYSTQHCAFKIGAVSETLLQSRVNDTVRIIIYIFVVGTVYTAAYFIFAARIKKNEAVHIENKQIILLGIALILFTIMLQNAQLAHSADMSIALFLIMAIYDILCSIFTLCILYGMFRSGKLEQEYKLMEHILHQQKNQMQASKENIATINIKCHDLKHQISVLSDKISKDELSELEKAISFYDSSLQTGNEALDVILAEKSLICEKNQIKLDCIADGERLSFMKPSDIYSLFGNALDNAIEAVRRIEETDKRQINMRIKKSMGMLSIHIANSFTGSLTFENGLPATTKKDKDYHGFGIKSIIMLTEKYKGNLTFNVKNTIFNLNILFPIEESGLCK